MVCLVHGWLEITHFNRPQLSNEKNPGCLLYIRDYTTQLYWNFNKPLKGSLLNNQYNAK